MQQAVSDRRNPDMFQESSKGFRQPSLQARAPGSKLLHSKWGGRHPTRLPETEYRQHRPWSSNASDGERGHQNYFEEFREQVLRIREMESAVPDNIPKKDDVSDESGRQPLELVEKLKRQNDKIEELELIVRELRTQQLATKRQHEHEVSDLKAQIRQKGRSEAEPRSNSERQIRVHMVHEAEINELRQENAMLQQRNKEIAKRAKVLASIHQHRMSALEAKLQSSLSINQHYLNRREISAYEDDSTMQLLNALEDNTTALLLRGGANSHLLGKKSKLRSCILAVIFTIRVKRQVHNERAWRIEVME